MINAHQVFDATLELCDVICNRYNTEELCESIVAECELRVQLSEFDGTLIGRAFREGVKVHFSE